MEQTQTIAQVIQSVISTAAVITAAAGSITFGLIQALKSAGLRTRFIGLITIAVGFGISILFGKLFTGHFWTTFNIAVGIVVGFATPGAYSAIKAIQSTPEQK